MNFICLSVVFIPGLEIFYFVITGCIYLDKIVLDKNASFLADQGNPSKASFLKHGPGKIFSGSSMGNIYVSGSEVSFHTVGEKGEIMILIEEYALWLKHILTRYLKKKSYHVVKGSV